jgi:ketosteroid isomerase-like protein
MLDHTQFEALMGRVAGAWSAQDTAAALVCFTTDAVYMEPPDKQLFVGHAQLYPYFGALKPNTYLHFQHLWFDVAKQIGCVEFSFGVAARPHAQHGIIVVTLRDGLIAQWREYVQKGPAAFAEFIATDGKTWQWHIGNYP